MEKRSIKKTRKPRYKPPTGEMNIPLGWKFEKADRLLVENPAERAVIALAKKLHEDGLSQSLIARKFTDEKVPNRGNSAWGSSTVRKCLKYEEGLSPYWTQRKARLEAQHAARLAAAEADAREIAEGRAPASPLDKCEPVAWGQKWLANRDGSTRAYWRHQIDDLRADDDNIVHLDGRDVGKTANLTTLALHYAMTTRKGSGLVAAALAGQLLAIFEEIEFQIENNTRLEACIARGRNGHRKMQRFPYPRLEFTNGAVLYFRPAGTYGEAFRSLHVDRVWVDEGAWLSEDAWRALRQCLKAGGKLRVYSTPNGMRNATYYRLTNSPRWRVFRWPSWLNPNWTPNHEADLLEFYGGRATAGWQHEVAGEHGAPTYGAFHPEHLALALQDVPEYRKITITSAELEDCQSELETEQRFETLLNIWPDSAQYYIGADLGYTNDPTEILVFKQDYPPNPQSDNPQSEIRNPQLVLRLVLRVHMEKVAYPHIAQCLAVIDSLLAPAAIGIDNGGNGLAVIQELLSLDKYKPRAFDGRLFGFDFGGTTPFELPNGAQMKKRTKELMTSLINKALQRREIVFPATDPEIPDQFLTQTYSLNNGAVTYSKGNDHIIDATRCMVLAQEKTTPNAPYNDTDYAIRPPLPLMVEIFTLPSMKNFPWD